MEAKLENIELFKNIVSVIKQLTDDIEFYLTPESFEVQATDLSQVCMIDLCLYKQAFEEYEVPDGITIGLNLTNFERILNMGKKGDGLELVCPQESDKLKIGIIGARKTINFNLNLMDIDQDRLGSHEIPYTHTINMDSKEFETTVKDILSVGDICHIKTNNGVLEFEVTGDSGTGTFTFDKEEAELVTEGNDLALKFNPKYLSYFAKCSKLSKTVEIKLMETEGVPLCCTYDLGEDVGHLRFYLAPMVDDEVGDEV